VVRNIRELAAVSVDTLLQYRALHVLDESGSISSSNWPPHLTGDFVSHLYEIVLRKCKFDRLPEWLSKAKELRMLTLQLGVSQLPEWLNEQTFPHLMYLDLSHNELRNLPFALAAMRELQHVVAQHNPRLTAHWTPHANSDDPAALCRYLKQYVAGDTEQQRHVRVMLLGLPMVGKSALLECLKHKHQSIDTRRAPARLAHARARTQCPIIESVKRQVEYNELRLHGVDELHCQVTDPPGTPCHTCGASSYEVVPTERLSVEIGFASTGDSQMAAAVRFFVSAENTVFLILIKGQGLRRQMDQAETEHEVCESEKVAVSWLSYIQEMVAIHRQEGRVILIGTHRDRSHSEGSWDDDSRSLWKLHHKLSLKQSRHLSLSPFPLFIDTLALQNDRPAVWRAIECAALELLRDQRVPKYINACSDEMELYGNNAAAPKYCSKDAFLGMHVFRGLHKDQLLSAFASLRKLGYIIALPSGDPIILKPRWFAAAASITLSPEPNPETDGKTRTVTIITARKRPGYITRGALCDQLINVKAEAWSHLEWPVNEDEARIQANQLVDFLLDIGIVLVDPASVSSSAAALAQVTSTDTFACSSCLW